MRKLFLLAVLLVLGWWYFDGSRKMTEASIEAFHVEQLAALDRHEAAALCASLATDYQGEVVSIQGEQATRETVGRERACRDLEASVELFRRLDQASRGLLKPRFDVRITRVELATDRKSARVESVSTLKVGETLLARTRSTDTLVRHVGRIKISASESRNWVYVE
ncbi:hypothetical protein [Marilutibacter aestuarii]|uniref:Nuclear transport factor 2 family protein n=1 Tax=Marilutibacter aestuarii TaxID=1706195 RepID=A0A508A8P4_9GAMM|nr:hypothetical protein [Lysobacter aestuarii]TQD46359.1 hypothetical protein FKV25_06860 [Lysobacter aestuarii]